MTLYCPTTLQHPLSQSAAALTFSAAAVSHLFRALSPLQYILRAVIPTSPLPPCRRLSQIGHLGVPSTAALLAYDHEQRLLAVRIPAVYSPLIVAPCSVERCPDDALM